MPMSTNRMSLEELRDSLTELPTIPETLTQILELLEDPNSGARDLAEVIRADAPLAAKILRLANSPLYQKTRAINNIQECVSVLGYRTVRQVALCVAVISSLGKACEEHADVLDYRELWRHSVAVGALAGELSRRTGVGEPETVFLSGLLHDLGKFVLTVIQPRLYGEVISLRREKGLRLIDVEMHELGYDHTIVGEAVAGAWNFPSELMVAVSGHHQTVPAEPVAALVAAADFLANTLDPPLSDLGFCPDYVDLDRLLEQVGMARAQIDDLGPDLSAAINAASPLTHLD